VQVELLECSTGLVELYEQNEGCDCVLFVASDIDEDFIKSLESFRLRLLRSRGCAPIVLARSKSDLRKPQLGASNTRRYLRKVVIFVQGIVYLFKPLSLRPKFLLLARVLSTEMQDVRLLFTRQSKSQRHLPFLLPLKLDNKTATTKSTKRCRMK
jgi:hypothetical protein